MVIIAISGPHGAGKTTIAKSIATAFNLRYLSAGQIFRTLAKERGMSIIEFTKYVAEHPDIDIMIDELVKKEALKNDIVLDSQLAYKMIEKLKPIRILVIARKEDRIKRLMQRENVSYSDAKLEIELRDHGERKRFKRLYNVDLWNPKDFHLVINTSKLSRQESMKLGVCLVKELVKMIKDGDDKWLN